ncbi:hypothetical protein TWF730_008325 [Orbilia blumenaviensis]|uniref:PLD phosphodiesterase domain-containing protein n=1 Tax=Orbilia blumenaviensis TaxID=1796055 RepID=A0AAV9V3M5_9PEZI
MISPKVQQLCALESSVTSLMNEDPGLTPAKAYDKIVPQKTPVVISALAQKRSAKSNEDDYTNVLTEDIQAARSCGNFEGTEPSDLFLKIFYHVLRTLEDDPRAGVVSPNLMGSTGVIPLTIMSIIPDIMRHYANLIVKAQSSIILATNFWAASHASHIITDALRELSRRRVEADLPPVDVKILYDRGNLKQTLRNHLDVHEKEYNGEKVQIPKAEEVPGITLQVVNFHVPPVGTFHAKWMIVDGRIAVLNSNNIQDVANLEMMCHYEGAIVDSFYDSAMISWHNALNPSLGVHKLFYEDETRRHFGFSGTRKIAKNVGDDVSHKTKQFRTSYLKEHENYNTSDLGRNRKDLVPFAVQLGAPHHKKSHEQLEHETSAGELKNGYRGPLGVGGSPVSHSDQQDHIANTESPPPSIRTTSNTGYIGRTIATEEGQDEVAKVLKQAAEEAESGGKHLASAADASEIQYDDTLSAEAERVQRFLGTIEDLTKHLNTTIQPNTKGTLTPSDQEARVQDFNPYIIHPRHKPFPIAMVNRRPFGSPGHQSVRVPQNEAWIAAIRLAEMQIFIQTPDLNASDLVEEIPKAVKRGVEVVLFLTLGYNDAGELLPFQNGTNEQIVCSLFESLKSDEEKERLKVYWYTAKDMRMPIHAKTKQRTSHIKLMVVDGHIGIQGSGNQDTQSWYHSQETNVMVDSEEAVQEWLWGIRSNQNTHIWGRVDNDGVWRAKEGRDNNVADGYAPGGQIPGALGGAKIKFGWVKGIKGAIERVQGAGGF